MTADQGAKPEPGSVEEFLLEWTRRLPAHIKRLPVKRWTERDQLNGFSLTVTWPKDAHRAAEGA